MPYFPDQREFQSMFWHYLHPPPRAREYTTLDMQRDLTKLYPHPQEELFNSFLRDQIQPPQGNAMGSYMPDFGPGDVEENYQYLPANSRFLRSLLLRNNK